MAGGFRRFSALLRKNAIQMIRSLGYLIGEAVVFSILFILVLFAFQDYDKINDRDVYAYNPQKQNFRQQVMLAKGGNVNTNDFNSFIKQLRNLNLKVVQAGSSEEMRQKLVEERSSIERARSRVGIYIKELDYAKEKYEFEMFVEKEKLSSNKGIDPWTGWQRKMTYVFKLNFGPDWSQTLVDLAFYEGVKKYKRLNVSEEVEVGTYAMNLKSPAVQDVHIIFYEMKNLIVITMVIFTVRGIMHDNEHMKDFMVVMGVTESVFYFSHITLLFIKQLVFVTPIAMLAAFALDFDMNLGMVFLANFFEFFAIIAFILLMSSLFKSAAVTTLASVVIFLGLFVWACASEVCIPSDGACMATFLNPLLAKVHFLRIVASVITTHKSYSFGNLFEWKSFHYPAIVPLAFILLDMALMLIAFVFITKWNSISCKRNRIHSNNEDKQALFSNAEEQIKTSQDVVDIEIKNVTKVYKTGQRAVHGLNLEAMKGQVTVLLGHNGAGKTTTFSMICGTEKPTEGTLNICGHPAGSEKAKKHIGYCSQKNTVLDSLTVSDHLRLAYNLKCAQTDFHEEMEELLELVDLLDYKNTKSKTLSGGQKRKLCLCMALIGESSVVLLDGPTAGMDVESRQEIETFLDSQKGNRTILLTTHYMDEAECLGDRVFIMSGGRVVCSGTSDFLKKRFASNYTLTVLAKHKHKNMQPQAKSLEKYLNNHVKDAKLAEIRGVQVDFELSADSKNRFATLFEDLEQNKDKLGIANFGLSMGNLEQVFLKVGHATINVENKERKEERVRGLLQQVYEDDSIEGCSLLMAQFAALFKKKLRYSMIKWPMTIFIQLLVPLLLLSVSLFSAKVDIFGDPTYDISLKNFGAGQFLTQDLFINSQSHFKPQFDKFITEELKTNEKMELKVIEGRKVGDLDDYANRQVDEPLPAMAITYGMKCDRQKCANVNGNAFRTTKNTPTTTTVTTTSVMSATETMNSTVNETNSGTAKEAKIAEFVLLRFNERHLYSLPTALNLFGNAKLRNIAPNGRITMSVRFFEVEKETSSFGSSLLMVLLMALVFASLTEPLAEDITSGFMYQCGKYTRATLMVLIFFYSVMPIVSWLSTKCKSASTATVTISLIMALGILAGMLMYVGTIRLFLRQSAEKNKWSKSDVQKIETNVFLSASFFFPSMAFLFGLLEITEIHAAQNSERIDPKIVDLKIHNYNMFVMVAVVSAIFNTLCFVMGMVKAIRRCFACKGSMSEVPPAINQEPQNLSNEIVLEVNDVSKVFRKKCALAHLSFQVQKQECFGLLGVSGAGKTTTFNIIAGQMFPSEGSVTLNGVDINRSIVLAKVHGYKDVDGVVEKLIQMVNMEEHAEKPFNTCSGGQKRRLSVAAALLPRKSPFVILDEATAGIDPVARRDVWSVLSVVREHNAILMSSHSMEECEALCNRISILKDGQIAATGSSQELKSRLGDFYVLSLSLSGEQHKDNALRIVNQHFPGSSLQKGSFSRNMKWKLPRCKGDLWSNVFERCQTIASKIGAKDFCVTQPSLQDIFLIIAADSENDASERETSSVGSKQTTGKTASGSVEKQQSSEPQPSNIGKNKEVQETQCSVGNLTGKKRDI